MFAYFSFILGKKRLFWIFWLTLFPFLNGQANKIISFSRFD
jgi:hypothetical protein